MARLTIMFVLQVLLTIESLNLKCIQTVQSSSTGGGTSKINNTSQSSTSGDSGSRTTTSCNLPSSGLESLTTSQLHTTPLLSSEPSSSLPEPIHSISDGISSNISQMSSSATEKENISSTAEQCTPITITTASSILNPSIPSLPNSISITQSLTTTKAYLMTTGPFSTNESNYSSSRPPTSKTETVNITVTQTSCATNVFNTVITASPSQPYGATTSTLSLQTTECVSNLYNTNSHFSIEPSYTDMKPSTNSSIPPSTNLILVNASWTTVAQTNTFSMTLAPSSSSKTPEATTVTPEIYRINIGNVAVNLPLELSITRNANDSGDPNDDSDLKQEIQDDLRKKFNGTKGFIDLEVKRLRNGSIIVSYTVILESTTLKEAVEHIKTEIFRDLQNLTIANRSLNVTATSLLLQNSFTDSMVHSYICVSVINQHRCKYGYYCNAINFTTIECRTNCSLQPNLCGRYGICFMDSRDDQLKCRCHDVGKYVYSGERCEIKTEKLELESNYIIAITAGSGGVLLLIILILIAVLIWKRNKTIMKDYVDDTHRSVSMEDLKLQKFENGSYHSYQGYRSRTPTSGNMYVSGLPESRQQQSRDIDLRSETAMGSNVKEIPLSGSRLVNGREHKVLKDDVGAETLIYQPSNLASPISSTPSKHIYAELRSAKPSVYDYIDTDKKYEILRPKVYGASRSFLSDI